MNLNERDFNSTSHHHERDLNNESTLVEMLSKFFHRKIVCNNKTLQVILFGQLLSIFNACTGAASTTLENLCGINSPTAQSGFLYVFLSIFVLFLPRGGPRYNNVNHNSTNNSLLNEATCHSNSNRPDESNAIHHYYFPFTSIHLQAPFYYYAVVAFLDMEANYLTYYAYRYTSFTSITVLASISIPSAMIFSRLLIKRKYNVWHFCGVIICFIGFIMTLGSDLDDSTANEDANASKIAMDDTDDAKTYETSFPHAIRGDALAIMGAMAYGLNDTLAELSVKSFSIPEFLGMLGVFGTLFSTLQILLLEPETLHLFFFNSSSSSALISCSTSTSFLLLGWNVISLSLYYIGASYFLSLNDAALLDVSLLSTNLYAILFVVFGEKIIPSHPWIFFTAVGLVISGVFVYEAGNQNALEHVSNVVGIAGDDHEANTVTIVDIEGQGGKNNDCNMDVIMEKDDERRLSDYGTTIVSN